MPGKPRFKPPTADRLNRSALHYLERYSSSAANLRKVLERKVLKACNHLDLNPADYVGMIDAAVESFVRNGLVDDKAYAETKVSGLRRRGGSKRKIEAHLSAKGVDRDIIASVLGDDDHSEEETGHIFARRRRLGPYRTGADRTARRDKDLAAMCRAGFAFETARKVIDAEQPADRPETGDPDRDPEV
ncbi:regulatory protein RecX [Roseibium sp. AS2]|uniref:regulatory protein RecX n=1 Tax=Roseibium sp. AS2 TaxID=3135781 RepID=UPI00316F09C2